MLADRVGLSTYAIGQQQSGYMMRLYKAEPPVQGSLRVVALLVWDLLANHLQCAEHLAELPVTHWATVPSLPARTGEHRLHRIAGAYSSGVDEAALVAAMESAGPRSLTSKSFTTPAKIDGAHVLLVDDTWTTGGHVQSAAMTLRSAGAAQVSTYVVARWLAPGWGPTDRLLAQKAAGDWSPDLCPWTAGRCP